MVTTGNCSPKVIQVRSADCHSTIPLDFDIAVICNDTIGCASVTWDESDHGVALSFHACLFFVHCVGIDIVPCYQTIIQNNVQVMQIVLQLLSNHKCK